MDMLQHSSHSLSFLWLIANVQACHAATLSASPRFMRFAHASQRSARSTPRRAEGTSAVSPTHRARQLFTPLAPDHCSPLARSLSRSLSLPQRMASLPSASGSGGKSSASNSASGSRRESAAGTAPAPRRSALRTSGAADAAAASAASQAAAPSIAKPAQQPQQMPPQLQQITLSTPTQASGVRTIAAAGAATQPSPSPLPLPPASTPVQFHLPSDTPDQEEMHGNASPIFSSQPPAAHVAPVPRLSPALRGFNAAQRGRQPNGSAGSSPNPSPRPSPRPSPSRSPSITAAVAPGHGGSKRPSFSLHDQSRPVLDWKPYDTTGRSHNVETILSPELREAQAHVAAKRAEHDKIERARYAHAGASLTSAADRESAPAAAVSSAHTGPSPHKRAIHPSSGGGLSLAVPPRKALPNAQSERTYDAGAEIFGTELAPPDKTKHAGGATAAQRRQYGVAPSSTSDAAASGAASAAAPSCFSRFRAFLSASFSGEIVMRTSPLPCFPSTTSVRSNPAARRDAAGFRAAPVRPRALGPPVGARWLYRLLEHSTAYTFWSIGLTVFSLFAYDFSVAFLPKSLDLSVAALLLACLIVFSLEILANCYAKANYCLVSFLFYLDVVGTFSLCFDIYWISQGLFGGSDADNRVEWGDAGSTSGDSTVGGGQVARSASLLRLTKFARVLRILKLVRIVRVFKFNAALQKTSLGSRTATPSKVGLTLSERQDKIVIGLVMILLILAPFFQVTPVEDQSGGLGLQLLGETAASLGVDRSGTLAAEALRSLFSDQLRAYLNTQIQSNHLAYLSLLVGVNSTTSTNPTVTVYHAATESLSELRSSEYAVFVYTSSLSARSGLISGDTPGNIAIFSHRSDIFLESVLAMCYTLLVVVAFVLGSFLLNRDVQILVVQPLDRMTLMVKKLAGTILFLNQGGAGGGGGGGNTDGALSGLTSLNNSPRGGGGGGGGGFTPSGAGEGAGGGSHVHSAGEIRGFETEAIEGMMAQIASIFNLVPDAHDPASGLPKSFAMLSGSKHTQIKTLNSVVQIDVSERPREPGEDGDFDPSLESPTPAGSRRDLGQGGGAGRSAHNVHLAAPGGGGGKEGAELPGSPSGGSGGSGGLPSIADFPELLTIDGILHNQLLLPYFKLFMTSSLTLENLLFVQEVDRFRTIVKLHVLNLYNSFISPRAHNQVNLPSLQRDAILSQLENPSACIFDEAQHECIGLMSSFLGNFHTSKYCRGYMARHRNRHHHVLKVAVKTGTSAGILGSSAGGVGGGTGKAGAVAGVVERVAGPMLTASTAPSRHGTAHAAQLKQISVSAASASNGGSTGPQQQLLNTPSNAPSLTVQLQAQDTASGLSPTHAPGPRLYNPAHAARPTLDLKVGRGSSQSASPRSQEQEQQLQLPGAVAPSPVNQSAPRSPASKSKGGDAAAAAARPRSTSPLAVPPRDSSSPPPLAAGTSTTEGRAAISRRRSSGGGLSVPRAAAARSALAGAAADAADSDDDEAPPVRLERQPTFTADAARRSTGKRAAPAIAVSSPASVGGAVLVGESDLDAQIAALQASEGNRRSWVEREAAVQRQSLETAARRASFNRHKSMGATQGNSIAQALDAAAAKREGRISPTTSTAGSTPQGRTPN